jgi:ElaB/YqjD/DUF883 family membrane-anchored ribosome-binding protein
VRISISTRRAFFSDERTFVCRFRKPVTRETSAGYERLTHESDLTKENNMPDTNYGFENDTTQIADQAADLTRKTKESISDTAKTVKDRTQEFGRTAVNKIEENRVSAASALHNAASSLHQSAAKLPNVPDMAHSTAEKVDAVASYMEGHDTKQMMADMEGIVKRNPGPSLLIAAAFGFLMGRALRNS